MPADSHSAAHIEQYPASIQSSRLEKCRRCLRTNSQLVNVTTIRTTKTRPTPRRLPGRIVAPQAKAKRLVRPPSTQTVIEPIPARHDSPWSCRLTIRCDAGQRRRQTKLIYLNHRLPSFAHRSYAPRSRSVRSLYRRDAFFPFAAMKPMIAPNRQSAATQND
jgi:hypothetical protein